MKQRNCQEPGFNNLKKPRKLEGSNIEYTFCPGKASWYPDIIELFSQCRVAMETGIMPNEGSFLDQQDIFTEVFPTFVSYWKDRYYQRIWKDIQDYTKIVLESLFKKKGKK